MSLKPPWEPECSDRRTEKGTDMLMRNAATDICSATFKI